MTPEERAFYEFSYDGWIPYEKHPVFLDDGRTRCWLYRSAGHMGETVFWVRVGRYKVPMRHGRELRVVAYRMATTSQCERYGMVSYNRVDDRELHDIGARILGDLVTMTGGERR